MSRIIVVARPGALAEAIEAKGTSVNQVYPQAGVSRATLYNLVGKPSYGIAKDKAERLSEVLGVPVGAIFSHKDGAPLA